MEDQTDWTAEETSHHPSGIDEDGRPKLLAPKSRARMMDASRMSIYSESYQESSEFSSAMLTDSNNNNKRRSSRKSRKSNDPPPLAKQEAILVCYSKILVATVLIVSTVVLGYFTHHFSQEEETREFENQFRDYADELVDQSLNNAKSSFAVLESFSKTVTSYGLSVNESWPLLTLPHFEIRGSDYLDISGAEQVAFAPIVVDGHREAWEAYTVAHQSWIKDGIDLEYLLSLQEPEAPRDNGEDIAPGTNAEGFSNIGKAKPIQETIWRHAPFTHRAEVELSKGPHVPLWQTYPAPRNSFIVNYNLLGSSEFQELIDITISSRKAVLSNVIDNFVLFGSARTTNLDPKSVVLQPIFESFLEGASIVGFLMVVIPWHIYFDRVLSKGADPVVCVLRNSCGEVFSYEVSGPHATFLGEGDWHDEFYDYLEITTEFAAFHGATGNVGQQQHHLLQHEVQSVCNFSLYIYPTRKMEDEFSSSTPILITLGVVGVFAFTSAVFLLYDCLVQRRQHKVSTTARKTAAIVTSLFPEEVHDRLFSSPLAASNTSRSASTNYAPKFKLRKLVSDGEQKKSDREGSSSGDAPIADLFPQCTVMFCDIAGFTSWSSVREPVQVFILLESVYSAFDEIAHKRKVFKVETIGDSYLAVAGLPTPRQDHATVMVKFAHDCLLRMKSLVRSLELELGPGTADLTMRLGLHSGPVTAGVLRGEKTRFQLFGDTVNTASRMESTGQKDKIQVSEETATLIRETGKEKWLKPRDTKITAKGKGELQTYWVRPRSQAAESSSSGDNTDRELDDLTMLKSTRRLHGSIAVKRELDPARKRAIHWIAEIMIKVLKQMVARRTAAGFVGLKNQADMFSSQFKVTSHNPIDEVQDVIALPKFNPKLAGKEIDVSKVILPDSVVEQLHTFIAEIALLYRDNPFHNFDHAAHVCMSISKLMSRIAAPDSIDPNRHDARDVESLRHDHTYGITSDPLTMLAVIFAATIHDADHPGCPNATLVREKTPLAIKYHNQSVAEQHSLDICWQILKSSKYDSLRACIYTNDDEMKRFRQLVVNSIIATDISDKGLGEQRKARWKVAFQSQPKEENCATEKCSVAAQAAVNRKATIVLEHLIQASDVAHTMQHWHIYTKWNEKLFQEMHEAFLDGKIDSNPADSWYQGELGFFDFYIIPLAEKLKECNVFGVSSAEYLSYAQNNRREWGKRGNDMVKEYVENLSKPSYQDNRLPNSLAGRPKK